MVEPLPCGRAQAHNEVDDPPLLPVLRGDRRKGLGTGNSAWQRHRRHPLVAEGLRRAHRPEDLHEEGPEEGNSNPHLTSSSNPNL